VWNWQLTSI